MLPQQRSPPKRQASWSPFELYKTPLPSSSSPHSSSPSPPRRTLVTPTAESAVSTSKTPLQTLIPHSLSINPSNPCSLHTLTHTTHTHMHVRSDGTNSTQTLLPSSGKGAPHTETNQSVQDTSPRHTRYYEYFRHPLTHLTCSTTHSTATKCGVNGHLGTWNANTRRYPEFTNS